MSSERALDDLVRPHLSFLNFIAIKMARRLPCAVHVDDLIQWGAIGLLDALKKFDPTRGIKFKTYAEFRIRGAILDGLRAQDICPRWIRDRRKEYDAAVFSLTTRFCRSPHSNEIAEALGLDLEEVFELEAMINPVFLISADDNEQLNINDRRSLLELINSGDSAEEKIINKIHLKRQCEIVSGYIRRQKLRDAKILDAYFFAALNLNQIGNIFKISESRVSQLIKSHLSKLRRLVEDYEQNGKKPFYVENEAS